MLAGAIEVHRTLGPALLESTYLECLEYELARHKLRYERQRTIVNPFDLLRSRASLYIPAGRLLHKRRNGGRRRNGISQRNRATEKLLDVGLIRFCGQVGEDLLRSSASLWMVPPVASAARRLLLAHHLCRRGGTARFFI